MDTTEGEDPYWDVDEEDWDVDEEDMDSTPTDEDGYYMYQADGEGSNQNNMRQSKSYTTAKTLNDREQRMLRFKLEHIDKEKKLLNHKIHLQQTTLKRDLRNINPYIKDDPDKGFFVPAGMTRKEAEKLRDNKRNNAPKSTRSISLKEFDEMRKIRSEAVRKAAYETGDATEGEKKRPTNRGVTIPPKIHAVSFTTLAKVVSNTISTANEVKKKRTNNKKESTNKKDSHGKGSKGKELNGKESNKKVSKWSAIAQNVVGDK